MGSLVSAIDELAGEDIRSLDLATLGADLVELRRAADRVEAEFTRRLAEFDRRDGAGAAVLSTAAWVRRHCRLSPGVASARVALARRLGGLPVTAEAFAAGDIGADHARVIALVRDETARTAVTAAEAPIVEYATRTTPVETRRLVQHVVHAAAPDVLARDAQRLHQDRWLSLSETFEGAWAIDGMLDPEAGATLRTALHALAGPRGTDDERSIAQIRADALTELARRALDTGDLPESGGERPHLTVTVDLATLEARAGAPAATLGWGGTVTGETARRLACDAKVTRLITDNESQPLDVGRTSRVVPPAIRKALDLRDRGCTWPGCDRPPPWTDAHHVVHWADGGPTSLANLRLLCRRHHRAVHEGRVTPEPPRPPPG